MLKDTFGKKWNIKLQSIELMRYLRELAEEIALLRKQLARMLQGIGKEKPISSKPIIVKSAVEKQAAEIPIVEKLAAEKDASVYKSLGKEGNKYDVKAPSAESLGSKLVGDASNKLVNKGVGVLIDETLKFIGKSIGIGGKTGPLLLATAATKELKFIMDDLTELEMAGVAAEQQDNYMERTITISNPSRGIDEVKKLRDEYMELLRTNSEEAGFKTIEVLEAGDTAVKMTGGDINKAIELVRVAEDMTASNPGSTLAESIGALAAAKIGDIEGLKSFRAQVSSEELDNIGFEGIVQQRLKPQFAGGVETHRNSDAGVKAAEEAYQENSKQRSGRVMLENKRKKETRKIDEMRRAQEYRKMDLYEKVKQFRDIDGQHKRLPRKETTAVQSKNRTAMYGNQIYSLPTLTSAGIDQPDNRNIDGQEQQSGIIATSAKSQADSQNTKPNVQNQAFTININGVNKSTNEIMNEMMPKLRLALANA